MAWTVNLQTSLACTSKIPAPKRFSDSKFTSCIRSWLRSAVAKFPARHCSRPILSLCLHLSGSGSSPLKLALQQTAFVVRSCDLVATSSDADLGAVEDQIGSPTRFRWRLETLLAPANSKKRPDLTHSLSLAVLQDRASAVPLTHPPQLLEPIVQEGA